MVHELNRDAVVAAAVDETAVLLHPPLPLLGVSIWIERECQYNDSLAGGYQVAAVEKSLELRVLQRYKSAAGTTYIHR